MTKNHELTAVELLLGEVQEETWTRDRARHTVRLKLFRRAPDPPLFAVDHSIFHIPVDKPSTEENRVFLFEHLDLARQKYRGVRKDPPPTYDTEP